MKLLHPTRNPLESFASSTDFGSAVVLIFGGGEECPLNGCI